MSEFLELAVTPKEPTAENGEIITAFLSEYPFDVFEHEGGILKAFGAAVNFHESDIAAMDGIIRPYILGDINTRLIPRENWNELWETHYFEPVTIDNRVRLRATFQPASTDFEYELVIQPKMSFGTGHHSTTQLMIGLMMANEKHFNNAQVLDMGAGTGILAILAEKLHAAKADAIDIEEWAAENIDENAGLNHCNVITAHHGDADLLRILNKKYDVILANIHKQVLLQDAKYYVENLNSNGLIFLSGFYSEDLEDIKEKYLELGCNISESRTLNNWCAAVFVKN